MDYFRGLKILMILMVFSVACNGTADPNLSEDLVSHVFQNYTASMIPLCQPNEPVRLYLGIALRQIIDLNEKEQLLISYVWVRLRWNDCRISWNSSDYNNITMITVPYSKVWVPDIALYDSASEGEMLAGNDKYRAQVFSDGTMNYYFPAILTSTCRVNVRNFPYDTQYCSLKFGSWSYNGFSLDIVSGSSDLSTYNENSEWQIDDLPVVRHLLFYTCCPEPYPDVTYYIIMKRRPEFFVTTWIFPCVLVSVVAALTFVLPVESGEKIGLNITVLLSLAVFMLVVTDMMPPSSDNFPFMGSYFAACMVLVSLSCVQTVAVITIFNKGSGGQRVPGWARTYIIGWLGRILRVKKPDIGCLERILRVKKTDNKISDRENLAKKKAKENGIAQPGNLHLECLDSIETSSKYQGESHQQDMLSRTEVKDARDSQSNRTTALLPHVHIYESVVKYLDDHTKHLKTISNILEEKKAEDEINGEWKELAETMDKLFLVVYLILSIIVFLYYFLKTIE